jgi:hypothetical protein
MTGPIGWESFVEPEGPAMDVGPRNSYNRPVGISSHITRIFFVYQPATLYSTVLYSNKCGLQKNTKKTQKKHNNYKKVVKKL